MRNSPFPFQVVAHGPSSSAIDRSGGTRSNVTPVCNGHRRKAHHRARESAQPAGDRRHHKPDVRFFHERTSTPRDLIQASEADQWLLPESANAISRIHGTDQEVESGITAVLSKSTRTEKAICLSFYHARRTTQRSAFRWIRIYYHPPDSRSESISKVTLRRWHTARMLSLPRLCGRYILKALRLW